MAPPADNWESIEPDQLQVGHYIKINHRWFDHPFQRRFFQITSQREIEMIREAGLSRLFVDRKWPGQDPAGHDSQEASDAERTRAQREAIALAQTRYHLAVERGADMLAMVNAVDPESAKALGGCIENIVAMMNNSATPLSLMAPVAPPKSSKRLALLGYDAVGLAGIVGKRLGLKKAQLQVLTQAAATYMIGLVRLPPHLMEETSDGGHTLSPAFRNYPHLSATILEQCGGFPDEVLRLVREHREHLDGRGFPRGLRGDQIHPHAPILGAVREFQVRCCVEGVTPVMALSYMMKNMKDAFGAEIINHLAATMIAYPPGTYVRLSDGRLARILRANEESRLRPVVAVLQDETSGVAAGEVDLAKEPGLSIAGILDTSPLPSRAVDSSRRTWSLEASVPVPAPTS